MKECEISVFISLEVRIMSQDFLVLAGISVVFVFVSVKVVN